MNWPSILPAIANLLTSLTGLQVFERDSPVKFTKPQKKARLDFAVIACSTVGRDERRYTYDPLEPDPNKRITLALNGNRQFTIGVKCEGYDHGYSQSAEFYLERIYTRLSRPSSQYALNAVDVAWIGAAPFVNLSAVISQEDRVFSIGQKDFFFTAAVTEADDDVADSPIGTIDSVELTSVYLYDVDGTPLARQIGPVVVP